MEDILPALHPCCPYCVQADGRLYSVKYKGDIKTMTFRCEGCTRSWEAETHVPMPESQWSIQARHDHH